MTTKLFVVLTCKRSVIQILTYSGTGASCIYPLLGCRIYGWHFVGTDIDQESLQHAQINIDANPDFKSCITLVHNSDASKIIDHVIDEKNYDFVMCNPPFFDHDEVLDKNCQATDNELKTSGGEAEFVKIMIDDSITFGDRIVWYTSMLGKKSSLVPIKQYLAQVGINQVYTTAFVQGKTRRWGIAWTLSSHAKEQVARNNVSSIVVSPVMRQTVFHYPSTAALFKDLLQVIAKYKILKNDTITGSVTVC
jgi:23S rRNA A1618 N6-methylase RlmF